MTENERLATFYAQTKVRFIKLKYKQYTKALTQEEQHELEMVEVDLKWCERELKKRKGEMVC